MTEENKSNTENPSADVPGKGTKPENQQHTGKKPIRFQFGPDTIDEDIENFLDMIFGPEEDKHGEQGEQQE